MIIYKCDTCGNTCDREEPQNWLEITGHIKNNLRNRSLIEANTQFHFCSRDCFEKRFFNSPTINLYYAEMKAFSEALKQSNLDLMQKRELYFNYFKENHDLKVSENIKDDINFHINQFFPFPKDDD